MMEKVVIASMNPTKIDAVRQAFEKMFTDQDFSYVGVSVESGISDQPTSDDEAYRGALNRASNAQDSNPDAEYYVGLEGGISPQGDDMENFVWVVIKSGEMIGKARSATFILPKAITDLVQEGKELSEADDIVFNRKNSGTTTGTVGILTRGIIDRTAYNSDTVLMALIPFANKDLY